MKKRIIYNFTTSEHIKRNLKMFEELGFECVPFKWFPPVCPRPNVLYLNWYESVSNYERRFIVIVVSILSKMFTIFLAKLLRIKIVSTFHNREAHTNVNKNIGNFLFKLVFDNSNRIVIFNQSSKQDLARYINSSKISLRTFFIPPVNYIGIYPETQHDWISSFEKREELKVLFFGTMNQAYKNAEMVMTLAREMRDLRILFVFAGYADEDHKVLFDSKIKGLNNVISVFRYIKDNEISHLFKACDLLVIPYDVNSVNNSGTARLAFSYGTSTICPVIPSMEYIPNDLVYLYSYSENSHISALKEILLKAYDDYMNDKSIIKIKGERLRELMERNNSPSIVKEYYRKLFDNL